ncbi:hypothetical protein [Streptomyces sp. NPDC052179]|uniref:hypothetical protein n=1 Tax=Streptomyces sp. NPDC052179 TaxID=3155680 RepID=UPI00344010AA
MPVRVIDADLIPGLASLKLGQGVDGDAPHVGGERLEAVVEEALSLPARATCSRRNVFERVQRWRCQNGYVPPMVPRAPSQTRRPA